MGALIVQQLELAACVANKEQRLWPDPGGEEITGVFHLAFMPDINPGRTEDSLHLQIENSRVCVA
jgi:hypothetical protein